MKKPNTWMPMYWGDYLRDTSHLTTLEHGVYLLLIGHYWVTAKPLPGDPNRLRSIAKISLQVWRKIEHSIAGFFEVSDGVWRHKRIDQELEKALRISNLRSVAGMASAITRRQQVFNKCLTEHPTNLQQNARPSPSPSLSYLPLTTTEPLLQTPCLELPIAPLKENGADKIEAKISHPLKGKSNGSKRGTRISPDWKPNAEDRSVARAEEFTDGQIDRLGECFKDYWIARAGAGGLKLDWPATWRNYVRSDLARKQAGGPSPGRSGQSNQGTVAAMRRLIDKHRRNSEPGL